MMMLKTKKGFRDFGRNMENSIVIIEKTPVSSNCIWKKQNYNKAQQR
jgi:hypothetical protein